MQEIKNNFLVARTLLEEFIADEDNWEKIEKAGVILVNALNNNNKVISCGNGGSMCDAMHFAQELTGFFREDRKPIPAIAISDPAFLTCTGNDYGYENIFSRYIECVGGKGDVLLAISTSGNSENVLNAARKAKEKEMRVIALTGKDGGKLGKMSHLEINVPHFKYSDRIQEIHIKIIHSLIHYIELKVKGKD